MTLTGRVAVVTGASQGIGRACALKLANCGASVALVARNREKLEAVAQEVNQIAASGGAGVPSASLRTGPARAYFVTADIGDEEQVKTAFKSVLGEFGKIDILVNNAGITRDQLVMRMKRADWDSVLATNLTSAYLCTQQVISSMLKQRWGRIINITSIFGQMGQADRPITRLRKPG